MHELFAAMPAFEMVKFLLVRALSHISVRLASRKGAGATGASESVRKLMFIDVSKAHLHALIDADVNAFVDLPPECRKPRVCGEINYWLYGMRPASKGWESECTKKLGLICFVFGIASPCCFHRATYGVSVVVHGDDFVFEGPAISFDSIFSPFQSHWIIKVRAIFGSDAGNA